jgi:hypothetical protein
MPLLLTRKRDLRHLCLMAVQMEDIEMDSRQQQLLEEQQQCIEDPHLVKTELQVCTKVTVSLHYCFSNLMFYGRWQLWGIIFLLALLAGEGNGERFTTGE